MSRRVFSGERTDPASPLVNGVVDGLDLGGCGREDGVQVDRKTLIGGWFSTILAIQRRKHPSKTLEIYTPPLSCIQSPGRLRWSQLLCPSKPTVASRPSQVFHCTCREDTERR
ncbi:hypothetical protein M7I_4550 [Glarea lozoyensis 74030]|uniref:Uncharacterized protein n=1 Tax=Glarea lozoyensis (strain ATCC 74030 / MF5533) TaxID=1104152 RepID=H0EPH1_GLAL7|nr:hypothetical protein M7I_4550 [Glarea lozoyensis 74030]